MKNEFETKLIKEEDQNVPQNVFLSKIKFKESLQEIESYYTKNKKDIDLIKPDSDKNLPLQIAVTAKHYEVVNFIIKNFSSFFVQFLKYLVMLYSKLNLSGRKINNGKTKILQNRI